MQLCLLPAFPTLFVVAALWTQSFLVHLYLSAVSRLSLSSNKQPLWAEIYEWECTRKSSVSGSSCILGGDPQLFPGFFFLSLIPCVGLQTINVTTCHRCMGALSQSGAEGSPGDGFLCCCSELQAQMQRGEFIKCPDRGHSHTQMLLSGLSLALVLPASKQILSAWCQSLRGKTYLAKNIMSNSNFPFKENSLNATDRHLWVIIQSKTNNLEAANNNVAKKY